MSTGSIHHWNAAGYHQHSSAQEEAAKPLFESIQLNGHEKILDVGCGDGKITAQIAARVLNGSVLGTDISREMIEFASTRFNAISNLTFSVEDAAQLNIQGQFNIIFSSFALQWVKNIDAFFAKAHVLLADSGSVVATIPLGVSNALEQSISELTLHLKWAPYFKNFHSGWHFQTSDRYKELLEKSQFQIIQFIVVRQDKRFPSRQLLEQYVKQWLTYLNPLPTHCKDDFFHELMDLYFQREPLDEDGSAYLRFERVDFIAEKSHFDSTI